MMELIILDEELMEVRWCEYLVTKDFLNRWQDIKPRKTSMNKNQSEMDGFQTISADQYAITHQFAIDNHTLRLIETHLDDRGHMDPFVNDEDEKSFLKALCSFPEGELKIPK